MFGFHSFFLKFGPRGLLRLGNSDLLEVLSESLVKAKNRLGLRNGSLLHDVEHVELEFLEDLMQIKL